MIIKRLSTGMIAANTYIAGCNGECVLIDAGAGAEEIIGAAESTGLKIKYIVLTHGHIDHVLSMDEIRQKTGAKVAIHQKDAAALSDPWYNASSLFGLDKTFGSADIMLDDGDTLSAGGVDFKIIHTPGHTPGCISIMAGNYIFTGDTLFRETIGRTDLGNGDAGELMESIIKKLMVLNDDVVVYPGHGTATTIGYERLNNPFI